MRDIRSAAGDPPNGPGGIPNGFYRHVVIVFLTAEGYAYLRTASYSALEDGSFDGHEFLALRSIENFPVGPPHIVLFVPGQYRRIDPCVAQVAVLTKNHDGGVLQGDPEPLLLFPYAMFEKYSSRDVDVKQNGAAGGTGEPRGL